MIRGLLPTIILLLGMTATAAQANELAGTFAKQLRFLENRGQVLIADSAEKNSVRYYASVGAMRVFFRADGFSYVMPATEAPRVQHRYGDVAKLQNNPAHDYRFDLRFVGANPAVQICGQDTNSDRSNFYHTLYAHPVLNLPSFNQIYYRDLYKGIDLRFASSLYGLKYEFIVHPGANPAQIQMAVNGAEVRLDENGDLLLSTPYGSIQDNAPSSYNLIPFSKKYPESGRMRSIRSAFRLNAQGYVGFCFPGGYNKKYKLVIDPSVMWSTYFGGAQEDAPGDIAVDRDSNIIVCGYSRSYDFPRLKSTIANAGGYDFTLSKFDSSGILKWSTFYGGTQLDYAAGVDVDANGNIFVTGYSASPELGFPTTAKQQNNRGNNDAVIMKFNSSGVIQTGSFLGGVNEELALDISVDKAGNPVIVGRTSSSDFPAQSGTMGNSAGKDDAFIARWNGQTLALMWSTYYGGSGIEGAYSVATDNSNNIYITGYTDSRNYPTTNGAMQEQYFNDGRNSTEVFISSFTSGGTPIWSTYYGGESSEEGNAICVLPNNTIAVGGNTTSSLLRMYGKPVQPAPVNYTDAWVLVMQTNGKPIWSTYLGGKGADNVHGICADANGALYIAGNTDSTALPLKRSMQPKLTMEQDAFISSFSATTGALNWSTVLGGNKVDDLSRIVADSRSNLYVAGITEGNFPLKRAYQSTYAGGRNEYFIARLCPLTPVVTVTPNDTVCEGTDVVLSADAGLTVQWKSGETANSITVKTSGKYWYDAVNAEGCSATSDTVEVVIKPKLAVQITNKGAATLCDKDSTILDCGNKTFKTYQWFDSNNILVGSKDTLHVKRSGTYRVETIDSVGCNGSSNAITITVYAKPDTKLSSTQPVVNGRVRICQGDSVRINTVFSFGSYTWKTGSLTPDVWIKNNDTVYATVRDANGCSYRTDSVIVIVQARITPKILSVDSSCIGSVVTIKATPDVAGAVYNWYVDGGVILSKADSNSINVRWNLNGKKTLGLRIGSESCSDSVSKQLSIEGALNGKVSIQGGDTLLCTGQNLSLLAPPGFKNYLWNTNSTADRITVSAPGRYSVQFDNGTGCIGYDSIQIARKMDYSTSAQSMEYDTVEIDSVKLMRIVLHNNSRDTMRLRENLVDGRHYRIDSLPIPSERRVAPGDSVVIYSVFAPKNINEQRDTIKVVISEPCPDTLFFRLHGVGKGKPPVPILRFHVEDVTINPANTTAKIPIKVWLEPNVATLSLDTLLFSLSYNAAMLSINGSTKGGKVQTTILPRPQHSLANVSLPLQQLSFTPQVVTELTADILLGDVEKDSLFIAFADVRPDKRKIINTIGGALVYEGLCREGGVRLIRQGKGTLLLITPNPVQDETVVQTSLDEKAEVSISLYATNGERVWHTAWFSAPSVVEEHRLSTKNLAAGVYTIVLQSPTQLRRTTLVVVK